jgi:glycosyltransferase involved in cell wall biosynthesis
VAPLRMGGGTRLKLLEALALARPVVSTTLGAEGFPVESGRELLLADSPGEFARAVLSNLDSPERWRAMGEAGRTLVRARYDWAALIPALEDAYARLRGRSG